MLVYTINSNSYYINELLFSALMMFDGGRSANSSFFIKSM